MIDAEERAARQRSFYLKLSPQGGQVIATTLGGFMPPGADSQEEEMRDTLGLWLRLQNAGAFPIVDDSAWWMTRFMDRENRMSREETTTRVGELSSFAVATIGMLMEKGILTFKTEPEIPKLVTSTYDPINEDIQKAILDRMEAGLKEKEEGQ